MDSAEDRDEIPTLIEHAIENGQAKRVPLTIISGFLGAGKSTLLRRILTERHGYRIAVIMNEFGDTADLEAKAINVSSPDDPEAKLTEEVLELANGCLCCSIKDTGIAAIEKLMQRKGAFDHILLETTGLADPGPIAAIFWRNEEYAIGLGEDIILDGVLCVVDGVFGEQQIRDDMASDGIGESLRQIAAADVILLNKVDLVSSEENIASTEGLIRAINPSVTIHRTVRGDIDLKYIMGIDAFSTHRVVRDKGTPGVIEDHDSHEHDHSKLSQETHLEATGITALQVSCPPLHRHQIDKLDEWIRTVLWDSHIPGDTGMDLKVLRCKGRFVSHDGRHYVLQGVQTLYELSPSELGDNAGVPEVGKLVFIGKGLDDKIRRSLENIICSL